MMADGDIVHGRPNSFYQEPYKNLCELYKNYIYEWEKVEVYLQKGLLNQGKYDDQQIANNSLSIIPKS